MSIESIFFCTRDGFFLFSSKIPAGARFTATPGAIANLEVVSAVVLEKEIKDFFTTLKVTPVHACLVLSEDVVFSKKLLKQSASEEKLAEKAFVEEIPFDPGQVGFHKIVKKDEVTFLAVNRFLFEAIQTIVKKLGWVVVGKVPVQALSGVPTKATWQKMVPEIKSLIKEHFFAEIKNGHSFFSRSVDWMVVVVVVVSEIIILGGLVGWFTLHPFR